MRWLRLSALCLLLASCSGSNHKTAPVSGRVTLNGQPLDNAGIIFQPVTASGEAGPSSGGFTDTDGRYSLKIVGTDTRGAVVGKHKVMISLAQEDPDDQRPKGAKRVPARYSGRKTVLECDVPPDGRTDADFALKAP
jgi:hypothetical protein